MWILFVAFIGFSFFASCLRLTFVRRFRYAVAYSALYAGALCALYPYSLQLNSRATFERWTQVDRLTDICILQFVESCAVVFLSVLMLSNSRAVRWKKIVRPVFLFFPSPVLFIGLFGLQTVIFNTYSVSSFLGTAASFAVGVWFASCLLSYCLRTFIGSRLERFEWLFCVAALLSLLSMFVPLAVHRVGITVSHFQADGAPSLFVALLALTVAWIGYRRYQKKWRIESK